ncbi:MAG: hypothetical protein FD124_111 [Alphaproteobacteria bacterium]|nr:MAG: hypothetical protein FD160_3024 [Caulobacteraceae bacterium]TPW08833.1 MAG: hypothetical protein FD124_111 [Alphaproteobacteria bacterium]
MTNAFKELRAAYGSFWALLGMLLSSALVFKFIVAHAPMDWNGLTLSLLESYRSWSDRVFEILSPFLSVRLTETAKDVVALWLVVGASVSRTLSRLFAAAGDGPVETHGTDKLEWLFSSPGARIAVVAASPVLWPATVWVLFLRPIVCRVQDDGGSTEIFMTRARAKQACIANGYYDHDLRLTLALQAIGVVAAAFALTLVSASGS